MPISSPLFSVMKKTARTVCALLHSGAETRKECKWRASVSTIPSHTFSKQILQNMKLLYSLISHLSYMFSFITGIVPWFWTCNSCINSYTEHKCFQGAIILPSSDAMLCHQLNAWRMSADCLHWAFDICGGSIPGTLRLPNTEAHIIQVPPDRSWTDRSWAQVGSGGFSEAHRCRAWLPVASAGQSLVI